MPRRIDADASGECCRHARRRLGRLGSSTQSLKPTGYFKLPYYVTQATWTAPATSRMLLDAGFSRYAYWTNGGPGIVPPDGTMALIPVTEQNAIDGHPANFSYRAVNSYNNNWNDSGSWRANMSYVSGAHSFKVGSMGILLTTPVGTTIRCQTGARRDSPRLPTVWPNWRTAIHFHQRLVVQDT